MISAFNAQRALPHSRQHFSFRQQHPDSVGQAQSLQAGCGQNDSVQIGGFKLFQAGIQVAAKGMNAQVRSMMQKLGGSPQAAGPHLGPLGQMRKVGVFQ